MTCSSIPAGEPGCSTPARGGTLSNARNDGERETAAMNLRWKEIPFFRQFLLGFLAVIFVFVLFYLIVLLEPSVSGLELFARANSTRTSIALTSGALLGPFPTPTGPTPTPSRTRAPTSTPTPTPSATPSPTPIRYFIDTATPRTLVPGFDPGSTLIPPTSPPQATNPPRQPTNPPQATNPPHPTNPPRATNPPHPTHPPHPPTHPPHSTRVPRATRTPRR